MIRKSWNHSKWMLTSQVEHARLAALIAASWNFQEEKPREEVFQAIRRHDDGWRAVDDCATLHPSGIPCDFDELPLAKSTELWLASAEGLEKDGYFYGAALVAAHFLHLCQNKADMARASARSAQAAGTFIGKARALRTRCLKKSTPAITANPPETDETFLRDLHFLQVCDLLSLLMCSEFAGDIDIPDLPFLNTSPTLKVSRKGETLSLVLSPIPFKKNLRDHLNSIVIPKQLYESQEQLQTTYKAVKPANNEVYFGAQQTGF